MLMTPKQVNSVDVAVGQQIRVRRLAKGISQSSLADAIGVTFQQVQKYERGTNRVSASKLVAIANALSTDVADFFGTPSQTSTGTGFDWTRMTPTDILIVHELLSLPDGRFKTSILGFLRASAGRD